MALAVTGKFVYILNPFGLRIDREGWWFEHSRS